MIVCSGCGCDDVVEGFCDDCSKDMDDQNDKIIRDHKQVEEKLKIAIEGFEMIMDRAMNCLHAQDMAEEYLEKIK